MQTIPSSMLCAKEMPVPKVHAAEDSKVLDSVIYQKCRESQIMQYSVLAKLL